MMSLRGAAAQDRIEARSGTASSPADWMESPLSRLEFPPLPPMTADCGPSSELQCLFLREQEAGGGCAVLSVEGRSWVESENQVLKAISARKTSALWNGGPLSEGQPGTRQKSVRCLVCSRRPPGQKRDRRLQALREELQPETCLGPLPAGRGWEPEAESALSAPHPDHQ